MQNFTCEHADIVLTQILRLIDQSGLLAAVAAQLLTFFKEDSNFKRPDSKKRDAILSLTYISLVSSIFATTSSLALTVASIDSHRRKRLSFFFIEIVFKLCVTCLARLVEVKTLMQYPLQGYTLWLSSLHAPSHRLWHILPRMNKATLQSQYTLLQD